MWPQCGPGVGDGAWARHRSCDHEATRMRMGDMTTPTRPCAEALIPSLREGQALNAAKDLPPGRGPLLQEDSSLR
jgi:hypothetical protein